MFGKHRNRGDGCGHSHGHRFARGMFGGGMFGRGRGGAGRDDHGHHGHHGGMRRGRIFDQGDLRFVILSLIAEKPRHGYEIIKDIEERLGGAYSPSPGVVYPTLTLLEELGYVGVEADTGSRKLYAIKPDGMAFLAANKAAVDTIMQRLNDAANAFGSGPPPQLVRAVENLRMALTMRIQRGPISDEQLQKLTAAIDAVVAEAERA